MNLANPFNLGLVCIVLLFWAAVMLLARTNHHRISVNLLILPFFFLTLGLFINTYRMGWGTYAIGLIHVMMLPALLKVAKAKR